MRIIGYVAALVMLGMAMQNPVIFMSAPASLLVGGLMIWGFLAAAGPGTGRALKVAFSRGEEKDLQMSIRALRTGRFGALTGGFFAAGGGLIGMLANMDDPSAVGPSMAFALLGLINAVIWAYFILLPLQAGVERRLAASGGTAASETPLDLMVLAGVFLFTFITFSVLLALFAAGAKGG